MRQRRYSLRQGASRWPRVAFHTNRMGASKLCLSTQSIAAPSSTTPAHAPPHKIKAGPFAENRPQAAQNEREEGLRSSWMHPQARKTMMDVYHKRNTPHPPPMQRREAVNRAQFPGYSAVETPFSLLQLAEQAVRRRIQLRDHVLKRRLLGLGKGELR